MLTLKRRRKRRVSPQRGRGAISGLFLCAGHARQLGGASPPHNLVEVKC